MFGDQWLVRMSRYESEHASVCLSEYLCICASTGASHGLYNRAVILCIWCFWLLSEFDVNAGCVCSISSDLCGKSDSMSMSELRG